MGLLDDAIREHLELKRRRGADPSEIERLEREALGPVRRPGYEASELSRGGESAEELNEPADQPTEFWSEGSEDEAGFEDHGSEFMREAEDWGASDFADTVLEPDVAPPVRPTSPPPDHGPPESGLVHEDEFLDQETVEHDLDGEYAEHQPEGMDRRQGAEPEPSEPGYGERSEPGYPERPEPGYPERSEPGYTEPEHGHPARPEGAHPAPQQDYSQQPEREDMLEETPEFLQDTPDHDRLWFEQRPPRDFDLDG